jgi:hypothetical protein
MPDALISSTTSPWARRGIGNGDQFEPAFAGEHDAAHGSRSLLHRAEDDVAGALGASPARLRRGPAACHALSARAERSVHRRRPRRSGRADAASNLWRVRVDKRLSGQAITGCYRRHVPPRPRSALPWSARPQGQAIQCSALGALSCSREQLDQEVHEDRGRRSLRADWDHRLRRADRARGAAALWPAGGRAGDPLRLSVTAGRDARTLALETSWDLPSLAPGATANVDVTVPGARRGDFADASLDTSSIAFVLDCHVWSNNSVRVTARNVSASTVDLAAAPLAVQVRSRTRDHSTALRCHPGQRLKPAQGQPCGPRPAPRAGPAPSSRRMRSAAPCRRCRARAAIPCRP